MSELDLPEDARRELDAKLSGLERLNLSGLITEERYKTMRANLIESARAAAAAAGPASAAPAQPTAPQGPPSAFPRYSPPGAQPPRYTPPPPPAQQYTPPAPQPPQYSAPTPPPPAPQYTPPAPQPPQYSAPTPPPVPQYTPAGPRSPQYTPPQPQSTAAQAPPEAGPPPSVPRYTPPGAQPPPPQPQQPQYSQYTPAQQYAPPQPAMPQAQPAWPAPGAAPPWKTGAAPKKAGNRGMIMAAAGVLILLGAGTAGAMALRGSSTASKSNASATLPGETPESTPVPTAIPAALRSEYLAAVNPLVQSWVDLDKAFKQAESKPCSGCPAGTFDLTPVIPYLRNVYLAYQASINELGVVDAQLDGQPQSDVGALINGERRSLAAFENALTSDNATIDTAGALTRSNQDIQALDNACRKDFGLNPGPPIT